MKNNEQTIEIIAKELGLTKELLKAVATVYYCMDYVNHLEEGNEELFKQITKEIVKKLWKEIKNITKEEEFEK